MAYNFETDENDEESLIPEQIGGWRLTNTKPYLNSPSVFEVIYYKELPNEEDGYSLGKARIHIVARTGQLGKAIRKVLCNM